MEGVQEGLDVQGDKDGVVVSNIAVDDNENIETDDQKARAGIWRVTGPARRSSRGNWTEEEDKLLQAAVERFKGKCWKKIAECLSNRTDVQCLHRWQKVLNPDLVKGPWTKEEDDLIVELVRKQGSRKWSEIAKHLPGRIGKQCRERWHNHLNPEINKNPWTREEELILIEAHSKYGNRWAEIAKLLHGRSENSIKNHWNCSLKKKLEPNHSGSGFRQQQSSTPTLCSTDGEAINGEETELGQSPRSGFFLNQNRECTSDSCSGDLVLGYSQRDNSSFPSKQASHSIRFKQNQDMSNNGDKSSGDFRHGTLELSNVCTTKQVVCPQLSSYNQQHHVIKSPFNRFTGPHEAPLLNSPQEVIDGSKSAYLTGGYDLSPPAELEHGSPSSNVWSNFSFVIPPITSSSTFRTDEYNQQKITESKWRNPTSRFPSTDSYIQEPSSFTTPEDTNVKRSDAASHCPASRLRRAAMTFQNTPSIIRKRLPKQASDEGKNIDGNIHKSDKDFSSPQKTRRLVYSSAINSVGKSLKDAFDIVWEPRK